MWERRANEKKVSKLYVAGGKGELITIIDFIIMPCKISMRFRGMRLMRVADFIIGMHAIEVN